jgi:DNA-binding transcriptional LysR family regulator
MKYFVAVAEELNFRRAAERLHMSQPPLSQQIAALEVEIRTKLFERSRQRIYLTPAGRLLLERARNILSEVERTRSDLLSTAAGTGGEVRIGFTASSALMSFVHRAIESFRNDYPSVRLTLSELPSLAQLEALHKRQLDLGIVRKPPLRQGKGLKLDLLYEDRLVVVVHRNNPLAKEDGVRIAQLRGQPFISYPRQAGISLFQTIYSMVTSADFYPEIVYEARDSATIVGMVAAGRGVAIVPSSLSCIQVANVRFLEIIDGTPSALYLARRADGNDGQVDDIGSRLIQEAQTASSVENASARSRKPSRARHKK